MLIERQPKWVEVRSVSLSFDAYKIQYRDQKFQAITELNKENNKKVSRRTVQYSICFTVREAGIEILQMSLNTYQYTHVLLTYCMSKKTPLAGRRRLEVSSIA